MRELIGLAVPGAGHTTIQVFIAVSSPLWWNFSCMVHHDCIAGVIEQFPYFSTPDHEYGCHLQP